MAPGTRLHVSPNRSLLRDGHAWLEVQAAKLSTPFKLQRYRPALETALSHLEAGHHHHHSAGHTHDGGHGAAHDGGHASHAPHAPHVSAHSFPARPVLCGGQPVRVLHLEANGHVAAEGVEGAVGVQRGMVASSNVIWQVERESATEGTAITWDTRVRLRHVGTERLLALADWQKEPPWSTTLGGGAAPSALPRALPHASEGANERLRTVLNPEGDEEGTLFELCPSHAQDGVRVHVGSHLWLRHAASGYWISYPTAEAIETMLCEEVEMSVKGSALDSRSSSVRSVSGSSLPDGSGLLGAGGDANTLLACKERQDADVFTFESVEPEPMHDMFYAKACREALLAFEAHVDEAEHISDLRPRFGAVESVLTNLIFFCSLSDNMDPMTREGLPQKPQQALLCELLVMEKAMDLIEKLLTKGKPVLDRRQQQLGDSGSTLLGGKEDAAIRAQLRERLELGRLVTKTLKLCQRLIRHVLRENAGTRAHAAAEHRGFVEKLQRQMDAAILATETLREIFVDNAALLESVRTETLEAFIELIKTRGRKPRYIEFFEVLCTCHGKAVRTNQWRLADLLFTDENFDLLLDLRLQNGEVYVSGNPTYFPTFAEGHNSSMKLMNWLRAPPPRDCIKCQVKPIAVRFACGHARCCRECTVRLQERDNCCPICRAPLGTAFEVGEHIGLEAAEDHREIRSYFEHTISLYQLLVVGRNQRNTERMRHLMPYKLVETIIMSAELCDQNGLGGSTRAGSGFGSMARRASADPSQWGSRSLLHLCASFAGIARSLYVDVEPHEEMTRVRVMRIWDEIEEIERSGKLASKNTMSVKHDFERLQYFMYNFLRNNASFQVATRFELNHMILAVLKLLHDMLLYGFFDSGITAASVIGSAISHAPASAYSSDAPEATPRRRDRADGYGILAEERSEDDETVLPPSLRADRDPRPGVLQLIPILLCVLDGRKDRMEERSTVEEDSEDYFDFEADRHKLWKTISCVSDPWRLSPPPKPPLHSGAARARTLSALRSRTRSAALLVPFSSGATRSRSWSLSCGRARRCSSCAPCASTSGCPSCCCATNRRIARWSAPSSRPAQCRPIGTAPPSCSSPAHQSRSSSLQRW